VPSRVLIASFTVCPAPDRHGVALLNVLKALGPRYQVDVLTLRTPTAELPYVERFMRTRMLRVPVGQGALVEQAESFGRALGRQLEGEDYDVVHLRSAWGGGGLPAGPKLVYEIARSTEGEPRAADAVVAEALAAVERQCLERADLILAPSRFAAATLSERGFGAKTAVVVPGVDIDHFDWEATAPESDGVPRVVYVGRIGAGRGIRLLLRAFAQVRARRPAKLVLAGPTEPRFEALLDEAGAGLAGESSRPSPSPDGALKGDIERLGPVAHDDIPRLLATATVCVAPASPDEGDRPLAGFPTKLLEYMACRRAVVAPRRRSVEELVRSGVDGLLFSPGDSDELAAQITRLLDDVALRERLAASGYERARRDHPASATRRQLLDAYARFLPAAEQLPVGGAPTPLDALPAHADTTTARRPLVGEIDTDTVPIPLLVDVAATKPNLKVDLDEEDDIEITVVMPND
jgi:glycosyltransferase involved in cell wall biosynthesis